MATIELTSSSFAHGEEMSSRHAYHNENLSPPLEWSGIPENTRSLAIICDDPNAPVGDWVHWVLYDLPPTTTRLPEGVPTIEELPEEGKQGKNDFGEIGYGGPWPPPGPSHRYFFRLYALNIEPDLAPAATREELLRAVEGHIVAEGELMGTFRR